MSLPANIRVNVRAPFPSRVSGGGFLSITKANGIWNIETDYRILGAPVAITPTQVIAAQDTTNGLFCSIGILNLINEVVDVITSSGSIYRIVNVAGDVTVGVTDFVILMQKTVGAPTNINLPTSASRGGMPVTVKDFKYDANTNNITFVPSSGETVDGFSAAAAAANGVAVIDINGDDKTLVPLSSGGWFVRK